MSKIDSRKELQSVYRRCLSAMNVSYKHPLPSPENCKMFEAKVAEKASKRVFANDDERKAWVARRYNWLYNAERARLSVDPNADLKAQIRELMASA